ncbi:MAG: type II secretion system F family protein [Candidatus Nealsonbacteria bacterium]|nr:type II secretion system F family protein [Candidatus Nealsonbacteria bacterium]
MRFNYQGRTKIGDIQTGIVEASSREAALDLLQRSGFFVTFLEEAAGQPFFSKKITLFGGVSKKDLVIFSRQLSLMFEARISLVQSLQTLSQQTKKQEFKEKILMLAQDVEGGAPFSQALGRFPKLFSSFFINMVKSGEASGGLSGSLNYLADHLEKEYQLSSKLKGAIIYPALIVAVAMGVLAMMMLFIIPNLSKVLVETGQDLPFLTKVVIGLSDFSRQFGWLVFIILTIFLFFAFRYFKTAAGSAFADRIMLRIPIIGQFLKTIYISRFAENLSTLISGGIPITQALEITGDVVGNDIYREKILEIKESVRQGQEMSGVLKKNPEHFPPLLAQMVLIGEKTGTIDKSLMNVVDFYRKEVERSIDTILSLIEPILIIFLGLAVAGLMGSVLLPLYKMTSI